MSAMIHEPHDNITRAEMTERQGVNGLFGFGAMVACTGAVAAAMSWAMFIGFVLGVVTTVGAATVVASGLVKTRG
jgi:Asp/Glu/hydantoin racemase